MRGTFIYLGNPIPDEKWHAREFYYAGGAFFGGGGGLLPRVTQVIG